MKFQKFWTGVMTFLLLTAMVGCSPSTEAEITPEASSVPSSTPPLQSDGLCANPLFPVKAGATWSYSSTGDGPVGAYSFTEAITDARADGFTVTSEFDGVTRTQEWSCRPEGLVALQMLGGPAAGLISSQLEMELTSSNVTGVILPATINPGQTWSYSMDFTGNMDMAGTSVEVQGTGGNTFTAIGMESVTVPAGTFDAMKIDMATTVDAQAMAQGIGLPITFSGTSSLWYASNVGLIKTEISGNLAGSAFTETITLDSYNIP